MQSSTIIQLNSEDLRTELRELINEILSEREIRSVPQPLSQTGGIELAEQVLGRSKSWLYKATSQNIIPYKKFGSKIIFNRSDLEAWLNDRAIDPAHSMDAIDDKLRESAKKKLNK